MNDALPRDIRGVLVPVTGGRLLLPNATVAEVIGLPTPEAVEGAPSWLLGRIAWRGWRVPLVSFSTLAGLAERERVLNSRVAVLKALGGNARMPFLAIVTQGFPRLTTLTADIIVTTDDGGEQAASVSASVMVRDEAAVIPDLQALEDLVEQALVAAA